MSQFAELNQRLSETASKLEKRALMAEYLRGLPVLEAGLAALYLAGVPFPETDGRALNVGGALLSRVLAQLTGAGQPEMHAAYLRHGGNATRTADALFLHRNSLGYRLARIQALTGLDLDDPDARLALQVSVLLRGR